MRLRGGHFQHFLTCAPKPQIPKLSSFSPKARPELTFPINPPLPDSDLPAGHSQHPGPRQDFPEALLVLELIGSPFSQPQIPQGSPLSRQTGPGVRSPAPTPAPGKPPHPGHPSFPAPSAPLQPEKCHPSSLFPSIFIFKYGKTPHPLQASLSPPKNPQLFSNLSPIHAGISNTPLLKHTAPNAPQTRYNPPKPGTTPRSPLLQPPCPPTASIPQEMPSLPQHPPQNRVQGGLGLPPLKRPLGVHSSQPPQVREDPPNQPCR